MPHSNTSSSYIGRFAPSPSGDLHFGSLIAALGSYLQARANAGQWRLRIDDIDPPREVTGAADSIQRTLEAHGLYWDGPVVYQSSHHQRYQQALNKLQENDCLYSCECTRKRIKGIGGSYDGHCRMLGLSHIDNALRVHNPSPVTAFHDNQLGPVKIDDRVASEDFIVRRKDQLFAYHLACVVDEHDMGITEVVRGSDLLLPTVCQLSLFAMFDWTPPAYRHLPVAISPSGSKFSKQNHARPLDNNGASANLFAALKFLRQPLTPDSQHAPVEELLEHAIENWQPAAIPITREIVVELAE
ncbi:tRNA glutamyl-Q(34) synthetase GluQRS [Aestuariibacter salexigens]|uniref:tRNA glutamyl-Q(34) synthetase GluQRS n=1 Tax=Aestuariibacter salexigens TaxID=226010 RepID=UPI0004007DF1|nr:tRNA glutamyl-Q(34) synthetase GluQRS [Aestuariibacter salexigens]